MAFQLPDTENAAWLFKETLMPAYWIARSLILDPDRYWKYAELVPKILAEFGGRVLVRGGDYQVVDGPDKFTRFIVIEFESMDRARACFDSPEYQAARENRLHGAGEAEIVLVEGGEFTSPDSLKAAAR